MHQLLLPILNKFIVPHVIQSASNVTDVDISIANQRQDDDLTIGTSLREYLRESEDELLGTTDLAKFYHEHVHAVLSKLVTSMIKWLPFDDTVINDIACLDPTGRLTLTTGMIRRLIERFPNFVPSGKDEQIEEFALYQTTKDLPPDIPTNTRAESTSGKPFGLLSDFAKCLCIPHGNADSERMFSCINLIVTDHCNQLDTSTNGACLDIKLNFELYRL